MTRNRMGGDDMSEPLCAMLCITVIYTRLTSMFLIHWDLLRTLAIKCSVILELIGMHVAFEYSNFNFAFSVKESYDSLKIV